MRRALQAFALAASTSEVAGRADDLPGATDLLAPVRLARRVAQHVKEPREGQHGEAGRQDQPPRMSGSTTGVPAWAGSGAVGLAISVTR